MKLPLMLWLPLLLLLFNAMVRACVPVFLCRAIFFILSSVQSGGDKKLKEATFFNKKRSVRVRV